MKTETNPSFLGREFSSSEQSIKILAETTPEFSQILTPSALNFIAKLQRLFGPTREKLLKKRQERQKEIDSGEMPHFLLETQDIRESDWKVAPIPADLMDRRVEITGPVDRKMVINALNSGAQIYMADFEDSHSPTWSGTIEGQINLKDAIRRTISYSSPDGKIYALNEKTAVLLMRPRGWHLFEKNLSIDGQPISASLFDFGLYFYHNAKELVHRGSGPYFYLPKLENHLEARLWKDIFSFAEKEIGIPKGIIRATVLIETILAAFEMDEIIYELRDYSAGLNCGRWDYIFSFIKKFRNHPQFTLPDRAQITMNVHFLQSYCQLLIKTCHRRGIHAMGGMAAQIPIKNDPQANSLAMEKVLADKRREAGLGHDGTWVAHPGLVDIARHAFEEKFQGPHQISVRREDDKILPSDLLAVPSGAISELGLRTNINISLLYLESWLRGVGCVPLYSLMEDAATAEISRAQIWQWIKHGKIREEDFSRVLSEELLKIRSTLGVDRYHGGKFELASQILTSIITAGEFIEFLTLPAYTYL